MFFLGLFILFYSFFSLIFSYLKFFLNNFIYLPYLNISSFFISFFLILFFRKKFKQGFVYEKLFFFFSVFSLFFFFIFYLFIYYFFGKGFQFPIISGWDSAQHYAMFKQSFLRNGDLLLKNFFPTSDRFGEFTIKGIRIPSEGLSNFYMPGFYQPLASFLSLFKNFFKANEFLLILAFYFYQILLMILSLNFFLQALLIFLKRKFRNFLNQRRDYLFLFFFGVFYFFALIILPSYTLGFASYLSFLFYFSLGLFFISLFEEKKASAILVLIFISLLLAIISWSFFLVPFCLFAVFLVLTEKKRAILPFLIFILFVFVFFYEYIYKSLGGNTEVVFKVALAGGVPIFRALYYFIFPLISLIFFVKNARKYCYFFAFFLSLLVYLFLFGFLQFLKIGSLSYLFYKTFLALFVLCFYPFAYYSYKLLLYFEKKMPSLNLFKFLGFYLILFLFSRAAIEKEGVNRFVSYLRPYPVVEISEINLLLEAKRKYPEKNLSIIVLPPKPELILWNGAINGANSEFYLDKNLWFAEKELVLKKLKNWLQERGKEEVLIIDTVCWLKDAGFLKEYPRISIIKAKRCF